MDAQEIHQAIQKLEQGVEKDELRKIQRLLKRKYSKIRHKIPPEQRKIFEVFEKISNE